MIKNFTIYGERCSGTNFIEAIISGKSYYYNNNRKHEMHFHQEGSAAFDLCKTDEFGHKHFFGFNDQQIINNGDETLFIGIIRNAYDWMPSLFIKKHHIPQVNFKHENFLFGEWYSIDHNPFSDTFLQEYPEDRNLHTGERYKNIFELRKIKLDYLHNRMPRIAKNYILIRYEDLCDSPEKIVNSISERFNLKIINKNFVKTKLKKTYDTLEKFRSTITKNLDWNIENLVGYKPSPNNIKEFYEQNVVDTEFDEAIYAKLYPLTKDFYQPYCKDYGFDDKHRLFYHYKQHGIYMQSRTNFSSIMNMKLHNNINIKNLHKGIDNIIPTDKSFLGNYNTKVEIGKNIAQKSKITVVSLARNCETQLADSINSALSIEAKKLNCFIYENDSSDQTKDILRMYAKNQDMELYHNSTAPEITVVCNDLGREDIRDRSLTRTHRLAEYRNKCIDWVKDNHADSDYIIVLDLDADLGFSINGIYNSIAWLNNINNAGGMGSYSLFLTLINKVFSHYDSFAARLNDWKPSEELDHNNIWFRHWHPLVGSEPVPFYSCFGGLAVYKTEAFLCGRYNGELGSEHVEFHQSIKENGWNMYLNPSSRFFSVFGLT